MVYFRDDLGSHVGRGTAESVDSTGRHRVDAEPEVDKLELLVPVYQDILSLDVTMHDIFVVQVTHSLRNHVQEFLSLVLLQPMLVLG